MDHAGEAQRTDLMTITRHVLNEQSKHPEAHGNFTILLTHIVLGCKFVCNAVTKAGLAKLIGLAGQTNTQGEEQKKLDVLSNDVFVKALISSGCTAYRTSQEPSVLKLKEPALDEITHALVGRYNLNFTRQDISSLWFLCKQEASLLNITDQACALFTPSEVVLLEWTDDLELFILKGYGNALNYQMGVPLLEDVVQSMEQTIMAKEEERAPGCYEKVRLRFAHAETLLPFSCLIGLSLEESGQEFKQSIGYQLLRCSSVFDANIHTPVSQLYGEILEENGIDLAEMKVLRRKMEEIAISVNQGCTTT